MNSILAQLRFSALDFQTRQMPQFREGQIFNGTVLKLMRDNLAVIEISRQPVVAKLETSLQSGVEYWFVVKKHGDTPTLQVVSSLQNQRALASNEQSVPVLLRKLGLPVHSTNVAIVSHFQKEGIPFTKSFIQTVSSFVQTTTVERGLAVVQLMMERNLPMNEQVFQAIHRFVTADKPFLTQLQQITTMLQGTRNLPMHVQQMNEQLSTLIHNWSSAFKLEGEQAANAQQMQKVHFPLQQLFASLGLQYEKSLVKLIHQPLSQELETQNQELKPLLLALLKENLPSQTKQLLQETVQRLTGQQLLMKFDDQMLQFLLQIPIPKQLGKEDAILQFQSKSKDGQIDTEFCRIIFYLQLPKLQETVVDVQIQNRIIAITIYNEHEMINNKLNPFTSQLKQQLERHDFTLSSVKWVHEKIKSPLQSENRSISFSTMNRYGGVDIKI